MVSALRCAVGIGLVCLTLSSCSGDQAAEVPEGAEQGATVTVGSGLVDAAWIDKSWQVAVCDEATFEPYTSTGWRNLIMRRHIKDGLESFEATESLPLARAHAEAAAMYRQAAVMDAWALIQTYTDSRKDTDPDGIDHLLAVSYAIVGESDKAAEYAGKVAADSPVQAWHAPWAGLLAEGGAWPLDTAALPIELPEVAVGTWPGVGELPHYQLVEKTDDARPLDVADPGALVALALWHDAAAAMAAGDEAGKVAAWGARYRLPVEPDATAGGEQPLALMFGSDFLVPGDADFVAALMADGPSAVSAHQDTSLMARLAQDSMVDGKLDVERALDNVASLREATVERMVAACGGSMDFHRPFADMAKVGALRVLGQVAEQEGDRERSGRLFISAYEASEEKWVGDPVALIALSGWDARNRFPMRATEIVHGQSGRYPSLEVARFGLDRLSLRIQFDKGPSDPGM